jgi:dienelactone hydrolase
MLHDKGVPTSILDSFTGRGFRRSFDAANALTQEAIIVDVYRALALLSTYPRIDPRRIVFMGFSQGGTVALYATLMRFRGLQGTDDREFAAYIALCPLCNTTHQDEKWVSDRPIRAFHGSADDIAPLTSCRGYVKRLRAAGKDVQLTEYLDVHHQFDVPDLPAVQHIPAFPRRSRCVHVERSPGQLVNGETAQPVDGTESYVRHGGTIGYSGSAHRHAVEALKAFLTATLERNAKGLNKTDVPQPRRSP